VLVQTDHDADENYFYLHDRLGSVRMVVDDEGTVQNTYTYDPFGNDFSSEVSETVDNAFKFTGQYYDSEINQYYLRARMYDPTLMRFTSIDPVKGKLKQPLTLHRYLYCANDPFNRTDPDGRFASFASTLMGSAMQKNLRKTDYKFHSKFLDKSYRIFDAFSMINLQRGIAMDMMVAEINSQCFKSFKRGAIDAGIKTLGFGIDSENLSRALSFVVKAKRRDKYFYEAEDLEELQLELMLAAGDLVGIFL